MPICSPRVQVQVGKQVVRTHNGLLVNYPGTDGMKTGFICDSGFNVVASATREGRKLVAVVLGEPSIASRRERAVDLLDNGFKRYFWKSLFGTSLDGLAHPSLVEHGPHPFARQRMRGSARQAPQEEEGVGRITQEKDAQHCLHRRELSPLLPKFSARRGVSSPSPCRWRSRAAHAAEPPDNVAEAIAQAAQACKDMDGTPNTEAVLRVEDLNGDGGEDWLADYAKLKCDGGVNPLCGSGGCTLAALFLGRRDLLGCRVRGPRAEL